MKVLIVVDMQNDFIDGSLGTKEAQAIIPSVCQKIDEYNQSGGFVIATLDTHEDDYLKTYEGKNLPVPHCISGTYGHEINSGLMNHFDLKRTWFCEKYTFASVGLVRKIRCLFMDHIESIELVGVCTDICVVSNALLLKAVFPEVEIVVDANCCAGVTPEKHEAALKTMESCQIKILNWGDRND